MIPIFRKWSLLHILLKSHSNKKQYFVWQYIPLNSTSSSEIRNNKTYICIKKVYNHTLDIIAYVNSYMWHSIDVKVQSNMKRDDVGYNFIVYLTRALPSTDELLSNEGPADIGRILNNKYIFFKFAKIESNIFYKMRTNIIHICYSLLIYPNKICDMENDTLASNWYDIYLYLKNYHKTYRLSTWSNN